MAFYAAVPVQRSGGEGGGCLVCCVLRWGGGWVCVVATDEVAVCADYASQWATVYEEPGTLEAGVGVPVALGASGGALILDQLVVGDV